MPWLALPHAGPANRHHRQHRRLLGRATPRLHVLSGPCPTRSPKAHDDSTSRRQANNTRPRSQRGFGALASGSEHPRVPASSRLLSRRVPLEPSRGPDGSVVRRVAGRNATTVRSGAAYDNVRPCSGSTSTLSVTRASLGIDTGGKSDFWRTSPHRRLAPGEPSPTKTPKLVPETGPSTSYASGDSLDRRQLNCPRHTSTVNRARERCQSSELAFDHARDEQRRSTPRALSSSGRASIKLGRCTRYRWQFPADKCCHGP